MKDGLVAHLKETASPPKRFDQVCTGFKKKTKKTFVHLLLVLLHVQCKCYNLLPWPIPSFLMLNADKLEGLVHEVTLVTCHREREGERVERA